MQKMSNIFIGLKKTCLGVLDRGERDKNNEIGLKEEGGIEMSTTVLHYAMLAPFACCSIRVPLLRVRMHPEISLWPNQQFYNAELKDDNSIVDRSNIPLMFGPLAFIDCINARERRGPYGSWYNEVEADKTTFKNGCGVGK